MQIKGITLIIYVRNPAKIEKIALMWMEKYVELYGFENKDCYGCHKRGNTTRICEKKGEVKELEEIHQDKELLD